MESESKKRNMNIVNYDPEIHTPKPDNPQSFFVGQKAVRNIMTERGWHRPQYASPAKKTTRPIKPRGKSDMRRYRGWR